MARESPSGYVHRQTNNHGTCGIPRQEIKPHGNSNI